MDELSFLDAMAQTNWCEKGKFNLLDFSVLFPPRKRRHYVAARCFHSDAKLCVKSGGNSRTSVLIKTYLALIGRNLAPENGRGRRALRLCK